MDSIYGEESSVLRGLYGHPGSSSCIPPCAPLKSLGSALVFTKVLSEVMLFFYLHGVCKVKNALKVFQVLFEEKKIIFFQTMPPLWHT